MRTYRSADKAPKDNQPAVRQVREDELHELLELYTHLHPVDDPLPPLPELEKRWRDALANPLIRYFGVEFEGKLVSGCMLAILPNFTHGATPFAVIENVVTHSDYRRRGFARTLLQHAMNCAWEAQCHKVMLLSGTHRQEAHPLYESLGFSRDGKFGYVATRDSLNSP